MSTAADLRTLEVLGVPVHAVDLDSAVDRIGRWADAGATRGVALATAHGVMDARRSPAAMAAFRSADLVVPDGMSMVWLLRFAGHHEAGRVYGADLMGAVCERSVTAGWGHFLLGGTPGTNELLARRLEVQYPGVRIVDRYSPPFRALDPEERTALIERIDRSGAHLVWVGLGSPKQDVWLTTEGRRLHGKVSIGVGAAFDFLAGQKRQAPRWVQRSGFEWLYRFAHEPRRLWPRYSRYPLFTLRVLARLPALLRHRRGLTSPSPPPSPAP